MDKAYIQIIERTVRDTLSTYSLPVHSPSFVQECPAEVEITTSWSLFWETLILNMRTETVSYSIKKRKSFTEQESKLIREIRVIENMDESNVSNEIQSRLTVYQKKLEELRKIEMEGVVVRSMAWWYEQGEKSTAYFLGLEKRNYVNKLIASLHDSMKKRQNRRT